MEIELNQIENAHYVAAFKKAWTLDLINYV